MSIALQWLAMAMVGFADAPEPKAAGPEITYQCQVIEVNGLHWREAVGHGLKPVTSQGGVTVWTASPEFFKTLPEGTTKDLVMSPKVTALSLAPAHMTVRNSHPFVTQVSWRGDGSGPRQTTETIREGMTWTIAGRSIDQGVLAQLVIEDTDIRSVHTVNVPAPATSSAPATTSMAKPPTGQASYLIVEDIHLVNLAEIGTLTMTADEAVIDADQPLTFKAVFDQSGDDSKSTACAESECPAAVHSKVADPKAKQAGLPVPNANAETCCSGDKANATECHGAKAEVCVVEKAKWSLSRSAQVQIPEIGHAEIAGEWLIPRDEFLVVGFGPHTVADKDGKAVVRERLALITAEEVPLPMASTAPGAPELPRSLPRVAVTPSRLAIPALPSRSLPQGVHADGTPAELPPLPDDEKAGPAPSPGDSSEPRPSPQSKKPRQSAAPAANPTAKPAVSFDNNTAKTAFQLARGLFKPNTLPAFAFPNLQFMMPLKPFDLKLPFNQKLQLELIGRVVPDTDSTPETAQADE